MGNLTTYRISDFVLFSKDILLEVFATYNQELWPLQILWLLVAVLILGLVLVALRCPSKADKPILASALGAAPVSASNSKPVQAQDSVQAQELVREQDSVGEQEIARESESVQGPKLICTSAPSRQRDRAGQALDAHGRISNLVFALVAAAWVFAGYGFHIKTFAPINWAAEYFAWVFFAEALFLALGLFLKKMRLVRSTSAAVGLAIFALVSFVPWELFFGIQWDSVLGFGWGADRTAGATMGLLLCTRKNRATALLFVAPLLWCLLASLMYFGMK